MQTVVFNLGVDVRSTLISSCQPLGATHQNSHFYTLIQIVWLGHGSYLGCEVEFWHHTQPVLNSPLDY